MDHSWTTGWWWLNPSEKWWSSSMGRMTSHILWTIKNVWNHQPDKIWRTHSWKTGMENIHQQCSENNITSEALRRIKATTAPSNFNHAPSTSHVWGCCITNFPCQDLDVYIYIYTWNVIYIYIYISMSIFIIIYSYISPWYPHDIPMISPWPHGCRHGHDPPTWNSMVTSLKARCVSRCRLMRLSASWGLS